MPTSYTAKIPDAKGFIAYTPNEDAVWRDLIARQWPNVQRLAARPYLEGLALLDMPKPACRSARIFRIGCAS